MLKVKIFTLAALFVVLMSNVYVGRAEEPDPRILWVADSALGRVDGFAVHPNGNIFSHRNGIVSEIDGKTGKLINILPGFGYKTSINSIDISYDGKFIVTSTDGVNITELDKEDNQKLANGNLAVFLPNTYKVVYRASKTKHDLVSGHDSSIVILDIGSGERRYVKTEEMITNIAFSPDSRFMATAGSREKNDGSFYTTLKLWDVTTLTLIKELVRYDNQNYQIAKIQFSPDNKLLAFKGTMGLEIFKTENNELFIHFENNIVYDYMTSIAFLSNETLAIQSKNTAIINLLENKITNVFELPSRSEILTNKTRDVLYVNSFYQSSKGPILALDLNKILVNVIDNKTNSILDVNYHRGILTIKNIVTNDNTLNVKIYNLDGKLIKEFNDTAIQNNLLSINLKLTRGIYILRVETNDLQDSTKFMVIE